MAAISNDAVEYIANHVILPPKLPHSIERPELVRSAEQSLILLLSSQLKVYLRQLSKHEDESNAWTAIEAMLNSLSLLNSSQTLPTDLLVRAFQTMKANDVLVLPLRAQNAVLILRMESTAVQIECFEASARASDVMGAKGPLVRVFPAHAVLLPKDIFTNKSFQKELAVRLSQMDAEDIDEMRPQIKKGGASMGEIRDTVDPKLVTDLLMTLLSALSKPVVARTILKRVRDEVRWKNALQPWRRSSLWLAIRVAIQTTLLRTLGPKTSTIHYKNFMIFFVAAVARETSRLKLDRDLSCIASIKLARRMAKLGEDTRGFVLNQASEVCIKIQGKHERAWKRVCDKDGSQQLNLDERQFLQDTSLNLRNSKEHFAAIRNRDINMLNETMCFSPHCRCLFSWLEGLPFLNILDAKREETIYALSKLEAWIANNIQSWTLDRITSARPQHCISLSKLADAYFETASSIYKNKCLPFSEMILTLLELWSALDRLAIHITPLIRQFSPEINPQIFKSLLLPKLPQLIRLHDLETYIEDRHAQAERKNPSIFGHPGEIGAFTFQLYNISKHHQNLKKKIEEEAKTKRTEKEVEWKTLSTKYQNLKAEAKLLSCEVVKVGDESEEHLPEYCKKCQLDKEADGMRIDIFEWPLPKQGRMCSSVVIELDCPLQVAAWRNLTWLIVHVISHKAGSSQGSPKTRLSSYKGLKDYHVDRNSRFSLASTIKAASESHYSQASFPVDIDRCCLDNASSFKLFDEKGDCWATDQSQDQCIHDHCTPLLPDGPYSNLQYALERTDHSQNAIIADQESCQRSLSLQEFISFGSLRADGERVQWLNIKRELAAPNLNLNAPEVCTLFCQAMYQAGSSANVYLRNAHIDLEGEVFGKELLMIVAERFDAVRLNWKMDHAILLLISVTLRTLSLTSSEIVVDIALNILCQIRASMMSWTNLLGGIHTDAKDSKQIHLLGIALLKAALLCKMTFDVDTCYRHKVLTAPAAVTSWILCCIKIRENVPGDIDLLPEEVRNRLLHDYKLSLSYCGIVRERIVNLADEGFEDALKLVWSDHSSQAGSWTVLESPNKRWIMAESQATQDQPFKVLHYNILEGELLVNGQPIGRLPSQFTSNEAYLRIFGSQVLSVLPSNMPGMQYMTSQKINGYLIHFAMCDNKLIIRAKRESRVLELVPHERFEKDLPFTFIHQYTHWLDLASNNVEFRSLDSIWNVDHIDWVLTLSNGGSASMKKEGRSLVDIQSQTYHNIVKILGVLDDAQHIHVTLSSSGLLEAYLPRFDLNFYLQSSGHLFCKEFGKIVDRDQHLGTLIGLKNKLVLCGQTLCGQEQERLILIPDGKITWSRLETHVSVEIAVEGPSANLFKYAADPVLRRLKDSNEPQETLYKAYLHALTSHFLPDPLTEYTGTEEALLHLRRQSLAFYKPPAEKTVRLLQDIAKLTPRRNFYPPHLELMEEVYWDSELSVFSQHCEFLVHADRIVTSGNPFAMFYPELGETPSLYQGRDVHLLNRARIRSANLRSPEIGGHVQIRDYEAMYSSRDSDAPDKRAKRSFEIASLVMSPDRALQVSKDLIKDLTSYGTVSGFDTKLSNSTPLSYLLELPFDAAWAPLQGLFLSLDPQQDQYHIFFLVGIIAYGQAIRNLTALKTLLAFVYSPELRNVPIPSAIPYFNFSQGREFNLKKVKNAVSANFRGFPRGGRWTDFRRAQKEAYDREVPAQTELIVHHYAQQWPLEQPKAPEQSRASHLNVNEAHTAVCMLFSMWTANRNYCEYFQDIQPILNRVRKVSHAQDFDPSCWRQKCQAVGSPLPACVPSLTALMSAKPAPSMFAPSPWTTGSPILKHEANPEVESLFKGIDVHAESADFREKYKLLLLASNEALKDHKDFPKPSILPFSQFEVKAHLELCETDLQDALKSIRNVLAQHAPAQRSLQLVGLWPRIKLQSLLGLLSRSSFPKIDPTWKSSILNLGRAITLLQRSRRLLLAYERSDVAAFTTELANGGQEGWDMETRPEWLLIEIESDFLIRPIQARVAGEMIDPTTRSNSLMQLNMGEGKSSVIMPIIITAVAKPDSLSRAIVLKPLCKQMMDIMNQRLGGLVNRRIYFMPFSRKVHVDTKVVRKIKDLYKDCMDSGGVLVTQPEHILSFKLLGIERLVVGDQQVAASLLELQVWLESNCRDVLDESDELLDVKFQLIYSLGAQRMMDGQPDRWILIEALFDLIKRIVPNLVKGFPNEVEVSQKTPSSFPTLRLLTPETGQILISRLCGEVIASQLPGLSFENTPSAVQKAARCFIEHRNVATREPDLLEDYYREDEGTQQKLLQLRGLFAHGILLHVVQDKRWSVNYGLHPARCMSAVLYRAKGVPAPSAEFGHPDVALALTCLSYYYTGLTHAQIRKAFEHLERADDPSLEYLKWIEGCESMQTLPSSWSAVNLENDHQCLQQLFPAIRFNKKIADYYLTNIVFPKEGREFDEKLSTSGWDIPSLSSQHLTTGFSGTNDNQFILPLSISQRDLPELSHTSAKVIDYVLRRENLVYRCLQSKNKQQLSAKGFLKALTAEDQNVKVIIDVGAQILDAQNLDFAKLWLTFRPDVEASIFFDEEDNAMVVTRDHKLEKLAVSSFQTRMDDCIVYLDEVHTRGTDLKLPSHARAAVTLGPRLTKDRLVQACMRMRKLAHGQSLMFVAPPEVHREITKHSKNTNGDLDAYDVMSWCLEQSCCAIEQAQTLRILQGLSHGQRRANMKAFLEKHSKGDEIDHNVDCFSDVVLKFREKEAQRLKDLYEPPHKKAKDVMNTIQLSQGDSDPTMQELRRIWHSLTKSAHETAALGEEHEREIAHEVERETQIQRPPKVGSLEREVDPDLQAFINSGVLEDFQKFTLAYDIVVQKTSIKSLGSKRHPWYHIRATRGFANTVQKPASGFYDNYLRPVNFVLTSKDEIKPSTLLMISPWETNTYLREIQSANSHVILHIYEPRVTKSMRSVDFGLDPPPASMEASSMEAWQTLDSGLRRELNLFAGQAYFNTWKDYSKMKKDLGPRLNPSVEQTLTFVRSWTAIRRKGQDFSQTHIGYLTSGRTIKEENFE